MPGVFCNGKPTDQPYVIESRAFCRGMAYRQGGTGAARPITDNPFPTWDTVARASWDRGWTVANDNAGSNIPDAQAACCPLRGAAVPT